MDATTRSAAKNSATFTLTLPSDKEAVITRIFDAPRERVWEASTDPKAIPHWWGPRRYTTTVDKMEVKPGGAWRFIQRDRDGNAHGFRGEFLEIVPPERLVQTFEWEGLPGHVHVETSTFEDLGGRTKLMIRATFETRQDRDGMVQSDMESGARESQDRLEEYLARPT